MGKEIMSEANSRIYFELVDSLDMNQFKEFTLEVERYYLESGYFFNKKRYIKIQYLFSYLLAYARCISEEKEHGIIKIKKINNIWKKYVSNAIWELCFKKNKKLLIEILENIGEDNENI